ncbi:restriction endonuclease subunit S [Escherichia albertii]|nr:restriction endonuclease subunit S [Escherichia albertii]
MSLGYISGSLPQEWETPFLKDMVYPKQWKTISVKDLTPSGYTVYGANGKIGFYSEYTHENPTIMLTCRGATCGNIHISEPFSYINGNAMALDNQPINLLGLHFLKYALQARGLEDTISGSAQPQITRQGLEKVQVPLPPLAEQKIIAEKLDTLLAQVDSTKARLEQIPQILKRFRQAVLGAAVSGNLTEAWRRKNNFNFDNWENLTLGHIVKKIEAGKNLKCIEIPPDNHQYGIIKISAVTWG